MHTSVHTILQEWTIHCNSGNNHIHTQRVIMHLLIHKFRYWLNHTNSVVVPRPQDPHFSCHQIVTHIYDITHSQIFIKCNTKYKENTSTQLYAWICNPLKMALWPTFGDNMSINGEKKFTTGEQEGGCKRYACKASHCTDLWQHLFMRDFLSLASSTGFQFSIVAHRLT